MNLTIADLDRGLTLRMKEMVTSIVVVVPPEVVVRLGMVQTVLVRASVSGSEEQAVRPRIAPKARSKRVVKSLHLWFTIIYCQWSQR